MTLIRYLLVGVVNTLVGLGIYLAMYFLHMGVASSNAFGYAIGIMSFALNKKWTFDSQDHVVYSFHRYLLVLAVAYGANLATVLFANSHFDLNPYLSQALGIVPYTAIGFLGSRYFAFRDRRGAQPVLGQANEVTATKKALASRPQVRQASESGGRRGVLLDGGWRVNSGYARLRACPMMGYPG